MKEPGQLLCVSRSVNCDYCPAAIKKHKPNELKEKTTYEEKINFKLRLFMCCAQKAVKIRIPLD